MNIREIKSFLVEPFPTLHIVGDEACEISSVAKIENAAEGQLAFIANPKYEKYLLTTKASAVIISDKFSGQAPESLVLIKVPDPYVAFVMLLEKLSPKKEIVAAGIHPSAAVHPSAKLASGVRIGACAVVSENVSLGKNTIVASGVVVLSHAVIGDDCIIYPNVTIYDEMQIGNRVIIHAGAVIGADGFGFAPQTDGTYRKIPQVGNVIIGDDVEIGANVCIDRATMGSTMIANGVKIDNLVQIAHNVTVGENTVMAAQAGISGSTKLGKNCVIAGQAGLVGHIELTDKITVTAQAGVSKSYLQSGIMLRGSPAVPMKERLKEEILVRNLQSLYDRVKELEEKLESKKS
jgi:UDP-3-O-[3-hydroxymyristoyl] glucosamine N-acyltransferase